MRIEKKGEVVEVVVKAYGSEYLDVSPEKAKFQLSKEDIEFILKAASICAENKYSCISMWDSRVTYFFESDLAWSSDDANVRLDSDTMLVFDRAISFEAYEKYTGLRLWTDEIPIALLIETLEQSNGVEP